MVYLEHSTHTYYNTENPNIKYKSVTTLLNDYKHEFNTLYHVTRTAKKQNVDVKVILDLWKKKNNDANEFGTYFHSIMEAFILNPYDFRPKDSFETEVIEEFNSINREYGTLKTLSGIEDIWNKYAVHAEKVLNIDFNAEVGLAGTSDIIEDVNDDLFNVYDFKTNETFNFSSKYNERLLPPLAHLEHCEMNDYTMQLSIYAVMYERLTKRKFKRGGLFYWHKEERFFKFIPITYHRTEAINLILDYKEKLGL
jgi:hypothetical protein